MSDKELERFIEFVEWFGVRIDDEFVYVHDGHTSVILNPNTEWKDFLGHSILQVAETIAKQTNKKVKWV